MYYQIHDDGTGQFEEGGVSIETPAKPTTKAEPTTEPPDDDEDTARWKLLMAENPAA